MMVYDKAPTPNESRTWVLWDIKSCPLPSGCDARRVALCIKRALEKSGYSGPLSITAIGHLLDLPKKVLRLASSTGVSLYHIPFDVVDILHAMVQWGDDNRPPANILLLSARDFSDGLKYLQAKGFNILRQIFYDDSRGAFPTTTEVESVWKSFLTDTMDSEEKSSETSECVWTCSVCIDDACKNLVGEDFKIFIEHLRSQKHREKMLALLPHDYKLRRDVDEEEVDPTFLCPTTILNKETEKKAPTPNEAKATTWVLWDMKSCPLPSGCDVRRVGPCIKRALEKSGYFGLLTITAIGHLLDFPDDVLQSLSSTGVSLYHIPFDLLSILHAMNKWGRISQTPANVLLISARDFSDGLEFLQRKGFNILRQILYDDCLGAFPTTTEVESLWKTFLTDTMDSEEKSSETSQCVCICSVCKDDANTYLVVEDFKIFIKHLRSQEHRERMLGYLPCNYKLKREEDNEEVEAARNELKHLLNSIPRTSLLKRKNTE